MEFILIILSSLLFTIPYYFPALFFLSWLAFIPLIYLIRDYNYSHSFIIALLVGFLNSVFYLNWIYQPLASFLKMPFSFNLFLIFIYFLFSALPLAVWVLVNKFLQPKHSYSPFIAALSWTVIEYLRFEFLNFNPFNYFAYTQASFSLIVQYAAYGGLFLVSFITVLIASYLLKIYLDPAWKKVIPLLFIFIILAVIPLLIGTEEVEQSRASVDLLVAKSIENENKFKKIEAEISSLSNLAKKSESQFIFTPAESLSFDLIRNNYYRDQLFSELEDKLQASYLQLGAQAAVKGSYDADIFNSLFLLSNKMEFINRSNQQRNIIAAVNFPYAEELKKLLREYVKLSSNSAASSRTAAAVEVEELNYLNLFESEIFIPFVSGREHFIGDQNLIVYSAAEDRINSELYHNLSFAASVYRAAETQTDLIRTVSGGYSGQINERGKIISKKRLENTRLSLELSLEKKTSYYQRQPKKIMDIIAAVFLLITLIKVIILLKNKWSSRN